MQMQYYAPLDPDCQTVNRFICAVENPMTQAYGAPLDEIYEGFERKHRRKCQRCLEYGLANIEVR